MQPFRRFFCLYAGVIMLLLNVGPVSKASANILKDTSVATLIKAELAAHRKELYFPRSVERFYRQTGFKLVWIAPDTVKTHATDAMLLLDCVVTYGLKHTDYHPDKLLYDRLKSLRSSHEQVSNRQKVIFDIWLTDAILAFENNLHYGRLNPDYSNEKIDAGGNNSFNAERVLITALKGSEFQRDIGLAQPQTAAYKTLKYHMYLVTGLYTSDCYEFPKADILKMAINMERLRWYSCRNKLPVDINIPSGILTVHLKNSDRHFNIKINQAGMAQLANTSDRSVISMVKVKGQFILRIIGGNYQKPQEIAARTLNSQTNDVLVGVAHSAKLSALLSKLSGNQSMPTALTYLTCDFKEGQLVTYKDIFHADAGLGRVLYKVSRP